MNRTAPTAIPPVQQLHNFQSLTHAAPLVPMEVPTSVFPTSVLQGSILVVEDDPIQIELYAAALPRYCIIPATTVAEALSVLRRQPPVVVLLDHQLAGGERGADHVTRFKQAAPQVPVIIVSGTLGIRDQLRVM